MLQRSMTGERNGGSQPRNQRDLAVGLNRDLGRVPQKLESASSYTTPSMQYGGTPRLPHLDPGQRAVLEPSIPLGSCVDGYPRSGEAEHTNERGKLRHASPDRESSAYLRNRETFHYQSVRFSTGSCTPCPIKLLSIPSTCENQTRYSQIHGTASGDQ